MRIKKKLQMLYCFVKSKIIIILHKIKIYNLKKLKLSELYIYYKYLELFREKVRLSY